jgi:arylsulfatase A-like enzyme
MPQSGPNANSSFRPILALAVWFGLLMGLLEGSLRLLFQRLDWLNWTANDFPVSLEFLWIAIVINLLLFCLVGLFCAFTAIRLKSEDSLRMAAWFFSFLLFLDLFGFSGRIRSYACIVLAAGLATAFSRWFRSHEAGVQVFCRKTLPVLAGVSVVLSLCVQASIWIPERRAAQSLPPAAPGAPNVLVLVIDTARADHFSAYGYARPTSPNLERLAKEGTLFENAIATSSWTLPTHKAMLTGRYSYELGKQTAPLDDRYPTLGEFLQARGYRTGAFSANTQVFARDKGFHRGFIRFEDFFHNWADRFQRTFIGRTFSKYVLPRLGYENFLGRKLAEDVNQEALRWIDQSAGRPFFAFLNYFDPHDPYLPPEPFRSKFSKMPKPGGVINFHLMRYNPKLTPELLQSETDAYDGALAYCDHHLGELLAELARRSLDRNTILIVTSDHGESLGEHGLIVHRNALYREVLHVPLVIRWPGRVPAGQRISQTVTHASLPATLMDLLGLASQSPFPGPSLTQLWNGSEPPADWPHPLAELAQLRYEPLQHMPVYHGAMRSIVSPEWHFIWHEKFGAELYDWKHDPAQTKNLAKSPEAADVVRDFQKELAARKAIRPPAGKY